MSTAGPELPSLEDVVRQHFGARRAAPVLDPALRRLKADHLKARGDEAIKDGNYRLAWERYCEAIEVCPGKEGLHTLHSNRSLAYYKAQRYSDALADADVAVALAPRWPKAYWRRAVALLALKRAPEAVLAYRESWRLDQDDTEGAARLWGAVQRLTREQLARGVLGLLGELQAEGKLEAPKEEEATEGELTEAMFWRIKLAHKDRPRPGPWYHRYMEWLQKGIPQAQAYMERSAVHAEAKCYLQARVDARAAISLLLAEQRAAAERKKDAEGQRPAGACPVEQQPGSGGHSTAADRRFQLAQAYARLGQAFMAEADHPDRDCRKAAKAYMRSQETLADRGSSGPSAFSSGVSSMDEDELAEAVRQGLENASKDLTVRQIDEIQLEIYHEGTPEGTGAGATLTGLGAGGQLAPGQRAFRLSLRLAFPTAKAADCSSRARELLRAGVAAAAGVDTLGVTIERIAAPNAARGQPHLVVHMAALVGADLLKAASLAKAVTGRSTGSSSGSCNGSESELETSTEPSPAAGAAATAEGAAAVPTPEQLAESLGGQPLVAALGLPDPAYCAAEIEDVTPACAASEAERAQQEAINRGDVGVAPKDDRRLAHPVRPKMELELPYKLYKLVKVDGSPAERVDKHPFCMSRVFYDATEKPEEVWAELADGSCRWRQTGGEVKILALKVPQQLPSKQLAVDIEPYSIKVWNRASGEVYLQGELERGVVPEDCFWTHCGGEGEDGCALYLRKMNLELLQKHWQHSEMWWPRLFRCHGEIAWDDYEKDYSDLPVEVLTRHRVTEAIQDRDRRAEKEERSLRDSLQERDDVRKRARQERLAELRTGVRRSWVHLRRGVPPDQQYMTA